MQDLVSKIIQFDKKASRAIFDLQPKSKLLTKLVRLSTAGYGMGPLFILTVLVSKNPFLTFFIFVCVGIIGFVFVESFIKKKVKRDRPDFLEKKLNSYSFPSTHSFAMALLLTHIFFNSKLYNLTPHVVGLFVIWCVYVVVSRIVYGHHYLIDVISGLALGALIGIALSPIVNLINL